MSDLKISVVELVRKSQNGSRIFEVDVNGETFTVDEPGLRKAKDEIGQEMKALEMEIDVAQAFQNLSPSQRRDAIIDFANSLPGPKIGKPKATATKKSLGERSTELRLPWKHGGNVSPVLLRQ